MPATGREYMRVDDQVDERRDPLLATAAAAALLKRNYEVLGDWPLAVTAYNHGRAGMVRAVDAVGSRDLVKIIRHYQGPGFKFASRNFYAELLAAVQVDKRYREYFGELNMHQPVRTDSVTVPQAIPFSRLASSLGVDSETMASHNPALTPAVLRGRLPVPRGYRLRLPAGVGPRFASRLAEPPASSSARARDKNRETRLASNPARSRTHRVAPGQTLSGIAKKYGTSVAAIERHNNLRSGAPLRVGRRLVIPVTSGS
jgi:membrane-bound lytic murein transglycosylase D